MITKPVFTLMKVYGIERLEARECFRILKKKRLYEVDKLYLQGKGIPVFSEKRCGILKQIDVFYSGIKDYSEKSFKKRMCRYFHKLKKRMNRGNK